MNLKIFIIAKSHTTIFKLTDRGSFYILLYKFLSSSAFLPVCHLVFPDDNSWKPQPIWTKFSHMTFN